MRRSTRLVEDLLDVARIAAGKVELQRRRLDLDDVLRAAVEACGPRAQKKEQTLDLLLLAGPTQVDGDADRLQQVFVNLVDNAIEYTDPGGHVWVKADIERHDAVVRVQDTTASGARDGRAPRRHGAGAQRGPRPKGSEFTVRVPLARAGRDDA